MPFTLLTHRFTALGPWWIGLAIALLDVIAIGRAVLRGHGVESTLAWIFGIIAFPGVGAAAYLLLANPSIRRTVRKKTAGAAAACHAKPPGGLERDGDRRIGHLVARLTGLEATGGNRVELLVEDERAFNQIEAALAQAKRTIWAEYYIVESDETGRRFLDVLTARARDGVEVRLIYDAVGSMGLKSEPLSRLLDAGGRIEPFLPVNPFRRRWAVHLRNHRKLIVIDGTVAFTGGMNIGDKYSGYSRRKGRQHFRDTHLRVEGPAVRDFGLVFADDWNFAADERLALPGRCPDTAGTAVVSPLPSGPDQRLNASAHTFFAGIASATRECYLTTPYFVPDASTIRALVTTATSGVDVRILLPSSCDVPLVAAAARSYYRELLLGGVRLFEFRSAMLHAKTMVVDRHWGIVGSANVDMRSFRLNFEIGAIVFEPSFAEELTQRFLRALDSSHEIKLDSLRRFRWTDRIGQSSARLLSPLL